jgi:hypothetical protein
MKKIGSAAMPLPIAASIVVSLLALVALWVSPIVGLALFGAVVLAGGGQRARPDNDRPVSRARGLD